MTGAHRAGRVSGVNVMPDYLQRARRQLASLGGLARAASLSPRKRRAIAKKASKAAARARKRKAEEAEKRP